jgi:hypothetical protein
VDRGCWRSTVRQLGSPWANVDPAYARNLCVDGGYDICAEMYNKNILAPLRTFVPKVCACHRRVSHRTYFSRTRYPRCSHNFLNPPRMFRKMRKRWCTSLLTMSSLSCGACRESSYASRRITVVSGRSGRLRTRLSMPSTSSILFRS